MISEWTNHLWQSTIFSIAVALLAVAFRRNRAQVRYWLWFSASLKFLIPFSLLINLGNNLKWAPAARKIASQLATPSISFTMEQITQPFRVDLGPALSLPWAMTNRAMAILGMWMCGIGLILLMRLRVWLRIRAIVRASTVMEISARVPVRSYPGLLEPGVVGFWHPILLLPADIRTRLTSNQLEAVLAHELCHVRRRDNLTSAVHMIVEAVFWFHPLVWWIGSRLVDERERACDEEVLSLGNEPQIYAQGILNVCKSYLESPLRCVSGVTGSNLKKRIHAIVTGRVATKLSISKKAALAAAAVTAVTLPLVIGMIMNPAFVRAQSQPPIETPSEFEARNSLNQGVRAFRNREYDSAIEFFKRATELDPALTNADLYLATAYAQRYIPGTATEENQKYADLAIQTFQKVLDRNPAEKTAAAGLGNIYRKSNRYDRARDAYLKQVQLDPENYDAYFQVGVVDWIIAHNANSGLSSDDRSKLIREGLQYLDRSMALNSEHEDTLWYQNLLLREKSGILKENARATTDQNEKNALLAEASELDARADDWSNRALELRKKNVGKAVVGGAAENEK